MSDKPETNRFRNDEVVDRAVRDAVRLALGDHKRHQRPVAGWDGKAVVIVAPEHIPDMPPETPPPEGDGPEVPTTREPEP